MPKFFDCERNKAIIAESGLWCNACLVGKPASQQSPDPRYCQGCYEFLKKEAELLPPKTRKPSWIPEKAGKNAADVPLDGALIMSTLNDKKIEVDIIPPAVAKDTNAKRGPKTIGLPEDLLRRWASEGMGAKAISTRLEKENGVLVSYKTIQRRLNGVMSI